MCQESFYRNSWRPIPPKAYMYSQSIYSEFMYLEREKRPAQLPELGLFPPFALFGDGFEGEHHGIIAGGNSLASYVPEDLFVFFVRQIIAKRGGFERRVQPLEIEIGFEKIADKLANGFFLVQAGQQLQFFLLFRS